MGNKSTSVASKTEPAVPTCLENPEKTKRRKPVYAIEELQALLKQTVALNKLALPLLSIIANYAEERPILMPDLRGQFEDIRYFHSLPPDYDVLGMCFPLYLVVAYFVAVKMVLCGDTQVGKTPMMYLFENSQVKPPTGHTIGVEFCNVNFRLGNTNFKAQVCACASVVSSFTTKHRFGIQLEIFASQRLHEPIFVALEVCVFCHLLMFV